MDRVFSSLYQPSKTLLSKFGKNTKLNENTQKSRFFFQLQKPIWRFDPSQSLFPQDNKQVLDKACLLPMGLGVLSSLQSPQGYMLLLSGCQYQCVLPSVAWVLRWQTSLTSKLSLNIKISLIYFCSLQNFLQDGRGSPFVRELKCVCSCLSEVPSALFTLACHLSMQPAFWCSVWSGNAPWNFLQGAQFSPAL